MIWSDAGPKIFLWEFGIASEEVTFFFLFHLEMWYSSIDQNPKIPGGVDPKVKN